MTLKRYAVTMTVAILLTLLGVISAGAGNPSAEAFDPAKTYKGKCVTCHGPKAEKKFDTAKTDEEHVQIILKGKKAEKPPNMPGYESKGVTAEQAKALLDYMKSIRQ